MNTTLILAAVVAALLVLSMAGAIKYGRVQERRDIAEENVDANQKVTRARRPTGRELFDKLWPRLAKRRDAAAKRSGRQGG